MHQRRDLFLRIGGFAFGLGLGAALMYLLDPDRGTRRRALLRDQLDHARHRGGDALKAKAKHVRNVSRGAAAELASRLRGEEVDDPTLEARVREKLGRATYHPSSIEVRVAEGRVTLSGPALREEVDDLLAAVRAVRGVREVRNLLQVHTRAGQVSGLQGEPEPG
ncbi:MAG TPA: BON domain-containing protein [Thermoanaerobaculia bacterium]|nr:BON domain-containing protein [Thermoanaerobaculia bacterium]